MLRPRITPCLLVHQAGLEKTTGFKAHKYVGDPINAVKIFNEKEADELIVLDIDATVNNAEPNYQMIADLAAGTSSRPGRKSEGFMETFRGGDSERVYPLDYALTATKTSRPTRETDRKAIARRSGPRRGTLTSSSGRAGGVRRDSCPSNRGRSGLRCRRTPGRL